MVFKIIDVEGSRIMFKCSVCGEIAIGSEEPDLCIVCNRGNMKPKQCDGITREGKRCKNTAIMNGKCYFHHEHDDHPDKET